MSDHELLAATSQAAVDERRATAERLALLAEVDARRLYLGEGCSSLFTYCTQALHLSEHAAYHRIETARAARYFPIVLQLVADGSVTTTTVALLRPHLTPENHAALLAAARHKSKREVECQVACLAPKPMAVALVRRITAAKSDANATPSRPDATASIGDVFTAGPEFVPALAVSPRTISAAVQKPCPTIAPLARDRYLLRVTLSANAHAMLRRAQDLMRHSVPNGDPAAIVERALTVLVDQLEKAKSAKTVRPRRTSMTPLKSSTDSRHIPAAVRREVWARDEGRCTFAGTQGRCSETGQLEFHHLIPFARGGPATVENIALRCRAHNAFESELVFGRWRSAGEGLAGGPSSTGSSGEIQIEAGRI
jgi:5-methylcytosine-specific restriction endonuclease McrA